MFLSNATKKILIYLLIEKDNKEGRKCICASEKNHEKYYNAKFL